MITGLVIALAAPWAAAFFYYPALSRSRGARIAALLVLAVPALAAPLAVPREHSFVRFLVATHAAMFVVGFWDLHRGLPRTGRPRFADYARFLPHPFHFVYRKMGEEPGPGRAANLKRLARGLAEAAAGGVLAWAAFRSDLSSFGLLVEHSAKLLAVYPVLDGVIVATVALWRLAGWRSLDVYREPILARTPADFWRRYNRPIGQFLLEDVAKPAGGYHAPVRATMAAFLASAILHEYLATIAIGRVQGYQTAFFLLQGVAVAATQRVKPRGLAAIPWVFGTILFNLASLLLFCASVDQVVSWYDGEGILP
ncbi:MAG: hypothetical protein HY720_07745 [Planctomycetes bacterium]|nr:hypothetical protein [Planctomycetota bacterium]